MSRAHFLDSAIVWRLATGAAWLCGDGFNVCPKIRPFKVYRQLTITADVAEQKIVWSTILAGVSWYAWVQCSSQDPSVRSSPIDACTVAILRIDPRRFGQDAITRVRGQPRVI